MKSINVIKTEEDCLNMQYDINNLVEWTEKWLVKFNSEKCKVMHGHVRQIQNGIIP